jgi:hypothetical protein
LRSSRQKKADSEKPSANSDQLSAPAISHKSGLQHPFAGSRAHQAKRTLTALISESVKLKAVR